MELTRKLAQFVCDTQFKDIPETAVGKARECFLDWLGVALAGTGDPDNPLPFAALAEKYSNAAILAISADNIEALIEKIKILEKVKDMNEIVALTVK